MSDERHYAERATHVHIGAVQIAEAPCQTCYAAGRASRDQEIEDVERLRELLEAALPFLETLEDEGPPGEGWQSEKLRAIVVALRGALGKKA